MAERRKSLAAGISRKDRKKSPAKGGEDDVGAIGRKTGVRAKDVEKDEEGFDDVNQFFASTPAVARASPRDRAVSTVGSTGFLDITIDSESEPPTPMPMSAHSTRSTPASVDVSVMSDASLHDTDPIQDTAKRLSFGDEERAKRAKEQEAKEAKNKTQKASTKSSQKAKAKAVPKRKPAKIIDEDLIIPENAGKRKRFKPLQFWANERVVYERGKNSVLPTISETKPISATPHHAEPKSRVDFAAPKPKKAKTKGSTAKKTNAGAVEEPPVAFDPVCLVVDPEGNDVFATVAKSEQMVSMEQLGAGDKKITPVGGKMFEEPSFSSGILILPPKATKVKEMANNTEIFYVASCETSKLRVTIHDSPMLLATGDSFTVPRGNNYQVENTSKSEEAKMYFVLLKVDA